MAKKNSPDLTSSFFDIRESLASSEPAKDAPLPARMRPRTLDEIIGQEHLLAEGKLLRRTVQSDRWTSMIFYGPPGCGKTTLAQVISKVTQ